MIANRAAVPFFFGKNSYRKFATVDGDPLRLPQIDAENLLKAADDLTNVSYWDPATNVTVADQGSGVFRITKSAATGRYLRQQITNWVPPWAATMSIYLELRAVTLDTADLSIYVGAHKITDAEVVSGTGSVAVTSDRALVSNLDSSWTKIRATGSVKSFGATAVQIVIYAGTHDGAVAGSIEIRNPQVILGDQEKPRPVGAGVDDWMMAYRPHNRLTGDGKGRYSVTDTEGLVSVGECSDIKVNAANGTVFQHPADTRIQFDFTYESGKYTYLYARHTSTANCVRIGVASTGVFIFRNYVDNVPSGYDGLNLVDGTHYRFTAVLHGNNYELYQDDKLVTSGTFSSSENATTSNGTVVENLVTNDLRIVTESYPRKASGIIVAHSYPSGVSTYGDPNFSLTQPDGSTFTVGSSAALLTTAKNLKYGYAEFGFDTDLVPSSSFPGDFFKLDNTNGLRVDTGVVNETPVAWAEGDTLSFLLLRRSDSKGFQALVYDSGKVWKRQNVTLGPLSSTSLYPSITNHDSVGAALYITRFALLDLSSVHESEFCGVLDTREVAVSTTVDYEVSAPSVSGRHFEVDFTCHSGYETTVYARYVDENNYLYFRCKDSRAAQVIAYVDGESSILYSVGSVFTGGVTYKLDFVDDGENICWCINGVEVFEGTFTSHGSEETVRVRNDSPTYPCTVTIHPYPALGGSLGATDRVVCPQDNDEADSLTDCMVIGRNFILPAIGSSLTFKMGLRYQDADNYLYLFHNELGSWAAYHKSGGALAGAIVAGSNGDFVDGDDAMYTLDAGRLTVYSDGTLEGSGNITNPVNLIGEKFKRLASLSGGKMDAVELWPLYVNLPFKL